MSSRRFLLSSPPTNKRAVLQGEEAYHLARVLRAEPGRAVELINGSGKIWRGTVASVSPDEVELAEVELLSSGTVSPLPIGLIQSLCKADRLEWILQKSTELGISEIFLLEAERSIVKVPKERVAAKLDRWRKIIQAAVKQSRRSTMPELHEPQALLPLCQKVQADLRLVLSENEQDVHLKTLLRELRPRSAAFCIGPEGGWTEREQETFERFGFRLATLGPNILRTETASIVATAILRYEMED